MGGSSPVPARELARRSLRRASTAYDTDIEIPERYTHERDRLSTVLRVLREAAGITGAEAAKRAGMSQPKISKIENAVLLPSVDAVETLLAPVPRAAGAAEELLELRAHCTRHSSRAHDHPPRRRAQAAADRRDRGDRRRSSARFQLAVVPGLLQTAEYMRRIFTVGFTEDEAARTVAARQDRQRVLYDALKLFTFLVTECALRTRPGPPGVVHAQLHRIRTQMRIRGRRPYLSCPVSPLPSRRWPVWSSPAAPTAT